MFDGKWRMEIVDEIWQFDTIEDLKYIFDNIIDKKDKFGRINNESKTKKIEK